MTKAHSGVPVAQLPGTEIVPYLLAQTPPTPENGGWGNFAANNPDANNPDAPAEVQSNEQRSRELDPARRRLERAGAGAAAKAAAGSSSDCSADSRPGLVAARLTIVREPRCG